MKTPAFLITAPKSGSGKTLLTCGLLKLFQRKGYRCISFKCGPDYIDPMFHQRVLGLPCKNLDSFLMGKENLPGIFEEASKDYDLAVIEGVMGYYDGLAGISESASAYEIACLTKTPAILLADAKGASLSLLAQIKGFLEFRRPSQIQGVIFNRISPMLYPRLKALVEEELKIKVYGYLPELSDICLESRHLGLLRPEEMENLDEQILRLSQVLEESLELESLLSDFAMEKRERKEEPLTPKKQEVQTVRLAVARDEAFCFLYEDNLQILKEKGAQLVFFSPLHEQKIPEDVQGLLLYGGYPELYARELSENSSMRSSIRKALLAGLPCIAECGGFLYLHQELEDLEGKSYPMCGVLSGKGYYTGKLGPFGYVKLQIKDVFGKGAMELPAHEFHYYASDHCGEDAIARKPISNRSWSCIRHSQNLFAGFPHFHYAGSEALVDAFLLKCVEAKELS